MRASTESATPGGGAALERLGDEKPVVTNQTTMNDTLDHAVPVNTHTRHRAQPVVITACFAIPDVIPTRDQVLDDVAAAQRENNVQGPTPCRRSCGPKVRELPLIFLSAVLSSGTTFRCTRTSPPCRTTPLQAAPLRLALMGPGCAPTQDHHQVFARHNKFGTFPVPEQFLPHFQRAVADAAAMAKKQAAK